MIWCSTSNQEAANKNFSLNDRPYREGTFVETLIFFIGSTFPIESEWIQRKLFEKGFFSSWATDEEVGDARSIRNDVRLENRFVQKKSWTFGVACRFSGPMEILGEMKFDLGFDKTKRKTKENIEFPESNVRHFFFIMRVFHLERDLNWSNLSSIKWEQTSSRQMLNICLKYFPWRRIGQQQKLTSIRTSKQKRKSGESNNVGKRRLICVNLIEMLVWFDFR